MFFCANQACLAKAYNKQSLANAGDELGRRIETATIVGASHELREASEASEASEGR